MKEMIYNEFIRIINDFQIFNKIIKLFTQKIDNDELLLKENFFQLLEIEIIKDCLMFLKNNDSNYKKDIKFGIIIHDFVLNKFTEENYLNFKLNLKAIKER